MVRHDECNCIDIVTPEYVPKVVVLVHPLKRAGPLFCPVVVADDFQSWLASHYGLFIAISLAGRVQITDRTNLHVVISHEQFHIWDTARSQTNHTDIDTVAWC